MNLSQIADRLIEAKADTIYKGPLTAYSIESIEKGRSSYTVSNLLAYCQGCDILFSMRDETTEDFFFPHTVLEVHKILNLLMDRYEIDSKLVYRQTGIHYTAPKSFDEDVIERLRSETEGSKYVAPLSVKTLLAVCEVVHCDLLFEHI